MLHLLHCISTTLFLAVALCRLTSQLNLISAYILTISWLTILLSERRLGAHIPTEASANDQLTTSRPQKIKADNQGCIKLTENVLSNSRAKHIEIRYYCVRDMWKKGEIDLIYELTATMTADLLTKAQPKDRHWEHATNMGVRKITEQVGANEATRR